MSDKSDKSLNNPELRQSDSQKVKKRECDGSCRDCKKKHKCKNVCLLVKESFSA